MTYGSLLRQAFLNPSFTATDLPNLDGKIAIVTGASAGIGKEICRGLAAKGCHVYCIGRNKPKMEAVIAELKESTKNQKIEFLPADLMDINSTALAAAPF